MLTEKDMEDAIINDPRKYIGEEGLRLIKRQYRIEGYIFDLLFEDRHGAKLIVEIQKGTLDREHTYKILDYYDEFRESHPKDFIELMVMANKIPDERKKRLRSLGIEFREIPIEDLLHKDSDVQIANATIPSVGITKSIGDISSIGISDIALKSYQLFKEQKNKFVEELLKHDPTVKIKMNWVELKPSNIVTRTNWFIGFIPQKWGVSKTGLFGVHFGLIYYRDRKTNVEYVRIPVGVEKPLKSEYHKQFKLDVIRELIQKGVTLEGCKYWPNVGFGGAKLIEPTPVLLNDYSWEMLTKQYMALDKFVDVVADIIKKYYSENCFEVELHFPA